MRRRKQTPINFWKCGHFSPVVIEEAEGGKIARCLLCGELGAVREGSEEALVRQIESVAGDGLRIGVVLGDRLFDEAQGLARFRSSCREPVAASRLNQVSSKKPNDPLFGAALRRGGSIGRAAFFSSVLGIWGSDPPLSSLPTYPHPGHALPGWSLLLMRSLV